MVVHLVYVDRTDHVEGRDQFGFHVPSKVAAGDEAKIAQFEESGHAVGVVGKILRFGRHGAGQWILGQADVWRGLNDLLVGHHTGHFELG